MWQDKYLFQNGDSWTFHNEKESDCRFYQATPEEQEQTMLEMSSLQYWYSKEHYESEAD